MKKVNITLIMLALGGALSAQSIKLPAGKKISVTVESKLESSTTIMGNQMDIENLTSNFADYEVKTVTDTGYTMNMVLKRVKASVSMSGQEQSFDSDDDAARNNPQLAELFSMINKPNEVVVGTHGASVKGEAGTKALQMGIPVNENDQAKFILLLNEVVKLQEGNHWIDSTVSEGNRMLNDYTISKTDDQTAEVLVKTTLQVNNTLKQFGMDVKQSLHGTVNSKRLYNKSNGQLIKEVSELAISGTMDMMGQSAPMTIKGAVTTTVN